MVPPVYMAVSRQLTVYTKFRTPSILKERRLTEAEASSLLGTSQSELARILRGQFRKISTAKMTGYLNMLESVEK